MNFSSKKLLFAIVLTLILSISNTYAQTENNKIIKLVEQKKEFSKNNETSTVYRIQLYNGNESQAYKIENKFEATFTEYSAKVIYKQPEWKTQIGEFKTRLAADKALLIIKKEYVGAIVLEDKI